MREYIPSYTSFESRHGIGRPLRHPHDHDQGLFGGRVSRQTVLWYVIVPLQVSHTYTLLFMLGYFVLYSIHIMFYVCCTQWGCIVHIMCMYVHTHLEISEPIP